METDELLLVKSAMMEISSLIMDVTALAWLLLLGIPVAVGLLQVRQFAHQLVVMEFK